MIHDHLAKSITKVASKSFVKMYNQKKVTIQKIFTNYWDAFLADPVVLKEVERMMSCGTTDSGFEIFACPHCHKTHIICYSCKSRFCNSCGIKFAK